MPGIAQSVAEEVQRQQCRHQHTAGKHDQPPINADGIDLRNALGYNVPQLAIGG